MTAKNSVFGTVADVSASGASRGSEDERCESSGGMDVVHEIGDVDAGRNDEPREDVLLESVRINDV